jgi:hypothetical protein
MKLEAHPTNLFGGWKQVSFITRPDADRQDLCIFLADGKPTVASFEQEQSLVITMANSLILYRI